MIRNKPIPLIAKADQQGHLFCVCLRMRNKSEKRLTDVRDAVWHFIDVDANLLNAKSGGKQSRIQNRKSGYDGT